MRFYGVVDDFLGEAVELWKPWPGRAIGQRLQGELRLRSARAHHDVERLPL